MWALFGSVLVASIIIGAIGIALTANVIHKSSTENMTLLCKNNADKVDITFAKIEESVNTLVHFVESELSNVEKLKDEGFRQAFSASVQKNALHHIESITGAAAVYLHYNHEYIGKTDGFYYARHTSDEEFVFHPLTDVTTTRPEDESVGWWYVPTATGQATWFEAYYDVNLKRYIVSYTVPIYKGETLVGVLGADIFTKHIEETVKEVSIFETGQAAVLKSDGTVLYHPNFERGVLIGEGDPGFDGVIEKLTRENATKELISYELKGEKKQLASCKLRNGMLMICFAPVAEIYRQQYTLILTTGILTCLVVLAALILSIPLSRHLARPIRELNEATKHLTNDEFDFELRTDTYEEIGELTKTFIETRKLLRRQLHLLDTEAHRDGLTGVGNKSAFMDMEAELNRAIADGTADFSVVVFDVNKLKVANDVFGHMAGDRLLQTIANHLSIFFGASRIFRMGGDEFVVILQEDGSTDSEALIAACIDDMQALTVEGYPDCKATCAYGSSRLDKAADHRLADVLHRADTEMYKNKTKTKKETYPWQEGYKGIKQLQIEKYVELLKSLKASTDDYLFLMNIETGFLQFFGGSNITLNLAEEDGIERLLHYVHKNDHTPVREAVQAVINRDTEVIDINFRLCNDNENDSDDIRWVSCRGNVIKDEMDAHFVVIGRISQDAVKHLYNPVTTLFNKAKLRADLQSEAFRQFGSLMLLDVDNLSEINLKHGTAYGDSVLQALAAELEKRFLLSQIYHAEKDRFVILLNTKKIEKTEHIFEDIKAALAGKCTISASVVPNDSALYVNSENIYTYAVQILNVAKKEGPGKLAFFSKESMQERLSAVELLEELKESVANGCEGFHLVFQPQISVEDYSLLSAETLLRYTSRSRGAVYPDQFIPMLEETGLINEVGLWVTDNALRQCKAWRKYNANFKISVNISPKQLEEKGTAERIVALLSKHELPGEALILEITESIQLNNKEDVVDSLTQFRQAGIQIAIDDFGTGYSNLGNLKSIQANILKVDRVFIRDIKENGYNYNLIYNVLEFAKSNSLKVCLEGVETKEEFLVLSNLRADIFQGYLFDRPCPAEIIENKYFNRESEEFCERLECIEQLTKAKRHSPSINMEMKTILKGLNIGLWIVRINKNTRQCEMYADEIMLQLIGADKEFSPTELYEHWYSHIHPQHVEAAEAMLVEMAKSKLVVQLEYPWLHPQNGEMTVRGSGRCTQNNDDFIVFEGFHRAVGQAKE